MTLPRVLVIACGALAHDLVRVKKLNQWDGLDIQCLPADYHNTPQLIPDAVERKIQENRDDYETILVGYSDCGTGGLLDKILEREGVERLPGAHCYEMFSGSSTFEQIVEEELGTFYLTDYLARHFNRLIIKGMGLEKYPEMRSLMFGNYKRVVYLAQLDDDDLDARARAAAEYLELDYERVFTGDNHLDQALKVTVGAPTTTI
ncbi:MAG: DUF1638 domain-containing protein [Pseudomonadota bacterium]